MTGQGRVLVTGGAGYIGGATARKLLERGYEVVVLDDLRRGNGSAIPAEARFVRGRADDPEALRRALDGDIDACLHFASYIEAGESMRRATDFFENNTAGTLRLLSHLIEAGVQRFVLSSTAAVYGDPVRIPIEEDDPTEPTNVYGETKLLVERALAWLHRVHGLRYATLRYFNAAGAMPGHGEMHDPETHLIPLLLRVATGHADKAVIFGDDYPTHDGTCIRDYIHIEDLADAHVLALDALEEHPTILCNLGNGRGFSVKEVLETVREVTGHAIPTEVGARRPGDPAQLVASSERARDLLGWKPRHGDLAQIVSSAWEWHRSAVGMGPDADG